MLSGTILITGGTGSLGKAILARAATRDYDCEFVVYSRDEVKQSELKKLYPQHRYILGDVRDKAWLAMAMSGVDVVIHAAAYKQVPSSEVNATEALKTNALGSFNVAMAAVEMSVRHVIGISTDKACAPINLYGQTKAVMEKIFQQACGWGITQFHLTRYGNVLGSRGSVVPFFQEQSKRGYVTITDPAMTRFWLTIDQAIDQVELALQLSPGLILVPKAPASDMATLARAIAPQAEQRVIGQFPGEKLHEALVHCGESMHACETGSFFCIHPANSRHAGNLEPDYEYTSDIARQLTVEELREMIG